MLWACPPEQSCAQGTSEQLIHIRYGLALEGGGGVETRRGWAAQEGSTFIRP